MRDLRRSENQRQKVGKCPKKGGNAKGSKGKAKVVFSGVIARGGGDPSGTPTTWLHISWGSTIREERSEKAHGSHWRRRTQGTARKGTEGGYLGHLPKKVSAEKGGPAERASLVSKKRGSSGQG